MRESLWESSCACNSERSLRTTEGRGLFIVMLLSKFLLFMGLLSVLVIVLVLIFELLLMIMLVLRPVVLFIGFVVKGMLLEMGLGCVAFVTGEIFEG